jgi:aspartyl/glutamyl-tRNA(Asn/Gln) amidotransferase C subunit
MSNKNITFEEIKKIALLARLSNNLSQEEIEKFHNDLQAILQHTTDLDAVDISNIDYLDSARYNNISDLRIDEPNTDQEQYNKTREALKALFPNRYEDYLQINGIFENN